jgi:hypothetical protein
MQYFVTGKTCITSKEMNKDYDYDGGDNRLTIITNLVVAGKD